MELGLYGAWVRRCKLLCFSFCLKILIFEIREKRKIVLPGYPTVQHPLEAFRNLLQAACKRRDR